MSLASSLLLCSPILCVGCDRPFFIVSVRRNCLLTTKFRTHHTHNCTTYTTCVCHQFYHKYQTYYPYSSLSTHTASISKSRLRMLAWKGENRNLTLKMPHGMSKTPHRGIRRRKLFPVTPRTQWYSSSHSKHLAVELCLSPVMVMDLKERTWVHAQRKGSTAGESGKADALFQYPLQTKKTCTRDFASSKVALYERIDHSSAI